jgi:hypothetical protein
MKGQVKDELENNVGEAALAYFIVLSRHLPAMTEEVHENVRKDSRSLNRGLNPRPAE